MRLDKTVLDVHTAKTMSDHVFFHSYSAKKERPSWLPRERMRIRACVPTVSEFALCTIWDYLTSSKIPLLQFWNKYNLGTNEAFWEGGGGRRHIITYAELCLVFCKENQISYWPAFQPNLTVTLSFCILQEMQVPGILALLYVLQQIKHEYSHW